MSTAVPLFLMERSWGLHYSKFPSGQFLRWNDWTQWWWWWAVMGSSWYPRESILLSHLTDIVCWGAGLSHRMRGLVFLPAGPETGVVLMRSEAFGWTFSLGCYFLLLPPAKSWWGIWVLMGWECQCFWSPGLHQLNKHRVLAGHRSIVCLWGPRLNSLHLCPSFFPSSFPWFSGPK